MAANCCWKISAASNAGCCGATHCCCCAACRRVLCRAAAGDVPCCSAWPTATSAADAAAGMLPWQRRQQPRVAPPTQLPECLRVSIGQPGGGVAVPRRRARHSAHGARRRRRRGAVRQLRRHRHVAHLQRGLQGEGWCGRWCGEAGRRAVGSLGLASASVSRSPAPHTHPHPHLGPPVLTISAPSTARDRQRTMGPA